MKAKFGMFMTDGVGKIGGQVLQRNAFGLIVRTKVVPSNPQTVFQQARRAQFQYLSSNWRSLSLDQQLLWEDETANYPRSDAFGDTYYMTGQNLYISLNMNLWIIGVSDISSPVTKRIPTPMDVFDISVTKVAPDFTLTEDTPATDADARFVIYCSKGLSPGIFYVSTLNKSTGVHDLDGSASYDFTTEYWTQYPFTAVGEKVFCRVASIDVNCGCMAKGPQVSTICT